MRRLTQGVQAVPSSHNRSRRHNRCVSYCRSTTANASGGVLNNDTIVRALPTYGIVSVPERVPGYVEDEDQRYDPSALQHFSKGTGFRQSSVCSSSQHGNHLPRHQISKLRVNCTPRGWRPQIVDERNDDEESDSSAERKRHRMTRVFSSIDATPIAELVMVKIVVFHRPRHDPARGRTEFVALPRPQRSLLRMRKDSKRRAHYDARP